MTAGRGTRHAGRKGGAPVRKSITTRYFYSTAVLLICSIAVMGFIQMYLAMGYFREENGTALIQTIDNAILAMQEAADDGIVEKRAEAAEAAGLEAGSDDYKQAVIDGIKGINGVEGITGSYAFDEYNNPIKSAAMLKLTGGEEVFTELF